MIGQHEIDVGAKYEAPEQAGHTVRRVLKVEYAYGNTQVMFAYGEFGDFGSPQWEALVTFAKWAVRRLPERKPQRHRATVGNGDCTQLPLVAPSDHADRK